MRLELVDAAERVREKIARAKQAIAAHQDFDWYPYNSLSNVPNLERLIGDQGNPILEAARQQGVVDLGCGDGDLSFVFEQLGCDVLAIDHQGPNHNGMRGVRALARELQSKVEIREMDMDGNESLGDRCFGLGLFLGALYHLKNPFSALEELAKRCRYCLLSTRVARCYPDGSEMPSQWPIAYLLGSDELNHDKSNYWIFSNAGLARLIERSSWDVTASMNIGDTEHSDPNSLKHDERAFRLLRSHHSLRNVDLVDGWHSATPRGWRWTRGRFSAVTHRLPGGAGNTLVMHGFVPPEVMSTRRTIQLSIEVDHRPVEPMVFDRSGLFTISRNLASPVSGTSALVTCRLDGVLTLADEPGEEFGIVVESLDIH